MTSEIRKLFNQTLAVAVVLALIGVYEFVAPSSFNHFVIDVIRLPAYESRVLHTPLGSDQFVTYSSAHLPRIGSVLDNLTVPWYFILGLGIAIEMKLRGVTGRWVMASIPLLAVCVVLTQSRAAMFAAVVTILFSLRRQIGRSLTRRVRLAGLIGLFALAGLPVMIYGGLAHRFVSSKSSNQGHSRGVSVGIRVMEHYPLGRGLATGAGAGQNAQAKGLVKQVDIFVPEDQWLQIGTQLGILGLAIYSGELILMVMRLRPRDTTESDAAICASGVRNGVLGIIVGGLFLQPFIGPVIAWTVFALSGLGVSALDNSVRGDTRAQAQVWQLTSSTA
jgi:hypothetical protein